MDTIKYLASAEPATNEDIVSALGIDWMMLIFQIVAFLVLVWVLGKFVYPWLMKSVDDRKAQIDSGTAAAVAAEKKAAEAEKRIAKLLSEARVDAGEIIANAKTESADMIRNSEEKSRKRADQIIVDAKIQIEKDIITAKRELRNESVDLVALAVEKIVGKTVSKDVDSSLIAETLKEIK